MSRLVQLTMFVLIYSGAVEAHAPSTLIRLGLPTGKKRLTLLLKNYCYPHEKLPLHVYASVGEVHHVALIIQHALAENKNVLILINAPDEQGRTPLHRACMGNHPKVVTLLLTHNASVTILDHNGKTARDIAEEMKFDEIVKLFDAFNKG